MTAGDDAGPGPGRGRHGLLRRVFGSPRRMMINSAVAVALFGALIVLDFRGWLEARMAYFPSRETFQTPAGYEDVQFQTPDGLELHGWFMPAQGAGPAGEARSQRPAIVHVHGNAGHVALHAEFSEFLTQAGFHVFVFDYRGYGRSEEGGRPMREAMVIDTHAAIDYLRGRSDVDADRIGMLGYSLGGVFGLAAAAEREEIRAVAAVASFSSWKAIAADHLGPVGRVLARRGVDAAASAARLGERPLLLVHGDADTIVPAAHSQRIEEARRAAGLAAQLMIVPGADHVTVLDPPRARQEVVDFFARALAPQDPEG